MKKINLLILLMLGTGLLLQQACKKECTDVTNPNCSNYDPCWNHKPANADFTINEHLAYSDYYYETDTICQSNGVTLFAKNQNSKYTWLIGSEKISQKQVYREGFPEGWISVSLICEVEPHSCLDSTQLIDTVTKRFYVFPCSDPRDTNVIMNNPWWGTWEGYNVDEPGDQFQITFGWISQYKRASLSTAGIPKGLPKQKPFYSHSIPIFYGVGGPWGYRVKLYKENGTHQAEGGFAIEGICKRVGNKITIDYKYNNRPYQQWLNGEKQEVEPIEWVHKTFIGKKISNKVVTQ